MDFFTVSTFRETLSNLTKKPRDGYHLAVLSVTATLPSSSNNDTNGSAKAE